MTLPLAQQVSLQLRLGHRLIVTAVVAGKKREGAVGLGIHRKPEHRCTTGAIRIDWAGPATNERDHPWCFVSGCPARLHDPLLADAIDRAIELEDLGGLHVLVPQLGLAHLPERLVTFYQTVLSARDRLLAERDHAQVKLYQHG